MRVHGGADDAWNFPPRRCECRVGVSRDVSPDMRVGTWTPCEIFLNVA
jgi:hypothetical protein